VLHALAGELEAVAHRLITERGNKASDNGGPSPSQPPSSVEDRLHIASAGLAMVESRLRYLLARLNEGV
jgi:hypothetical protein